MAASDRLEQMVGDLVQIVETAKAVPMSASCVINRAEVLDILHALADGVADELAESRRLMAERDEVIAQARRDAADHIEAARRERGSMLSGTEMGREAERIRHAAMEEARRIREDADAYVDDRLANFEVVLTKTLQAVGRGRAKIGGRDPMDELGQHMAEQDAVDAANRADYEFDARDHDFDDRERERAGAGGYRREAEARIEYHTGEYPKYTEEAYAAAQPAGYDDGYAQHSDYGLPEPELSHEFAQADMSGVFQRPDFSQEYAQADYGQPQPVAAAYGYEDQAGYGGYADPAQQHQPYPVQPYGAQYGDYQQPQYQPADQYQQVDQYGQPVHPSHQQHPQAQSQEATGFFDTGMIDVRQFRDDPYQR